MMSEDHDGAKQKQSTLQVCIYMNTLGGPKHITEGSGYIAKHCLVSRTTKEHSISTAQMWLNWKSKIVRYSIFKNSPVRYRRKVVPFMGSTGNRRVLACSCNVAWNANFMNMIHTW